MSKDTGIPWAKHTFNPWWGCNKVSPGCDNCYAEKWANRWGFNKLWGRGVRRTFGIDHWNEPMKWNADAKKQGITERVFCGSMCDIFEQRRSADLDLYRARVFDLIHLTPNLEWLLLTKRPENIGEMISVFSWSIDRSPNIRIGTTIENQDVLDKRLTDLFKNWQGKNFISVEPMLSEVKFKQNWIDYLDGWYTETEFDSHGDPEPVQAPMPKIDWVICGCESGSSARPLDIDWVRDLRDQCAAANTPFFLKQLVIDGKLVKEPYLDGRKHLEFPKAG
jgi:protein gp37